jgi:nitrogen fixation/metabolism regulation signal transduction histidine kinase
MGAEKFEGQSHSPQSRRKLTRFFASPKMQLRYGTYFTVVASCVLVIWGAMSVYFMMAILRFDPKIADGMSLTQYLTANLEANQWVFGGALALSAVLFLCLSMVLTERIVGPVKALLKHIDALDRGHYDFKTHLRKTDELKPLMVALNQLSDSLHARHGANVSIDNKNETL